MIFRCATASNVRAVVVAHVRRAVGPRLEVRGGREHREIEAVPFAQPAVVRRHRFQPLLMSDRDAPQHFPVEERTERADPGVVPERRERLADAHHVGFGDADVQRPPLIDSARRRPRGRWSSPDRRRSTPRADRAQTPSSRRDDVAGRVLLRSDRARGSSAASYSMRLFARRHARRSRRDR